MTPPPPPTSPAPSDWDLVERRLTSPLGELIAVAASSDEGSGVCLLEFVDRPALRDSRAQLGRHFGTEPAGAGGIVAGELLDRLESEVASYFVDATSPFSVPLLTPGTEFQRTVWSALGDIPVGETESYGGLARRVGSEGGARAVGAANGANRISVIIPCHRVIESTGALRGYGGGLPRKKWLLDHERAGVGSTLFGVGTA